MFKFDSFNFISTRIKLKLIIEQYIMFKLDSFNFMSND
jgi:hypothetical protein